MSERICPCCGEIDCYWWEKFGPPAGADSTEEQQR